jgi:hypothetical protein
MDNDLFLAFVNLQSRTARLLKTIDELERLYPYTTMTSMTSMQTPSPQIKGS